MSRLGKLPRKLKKRRHGKARDVARASRAGDRAVRRFTRDMVAFGMVVMRADGDLCTAEFLNQGWPGEAP